MPLPFDGDLEKWHADYYPREHQLDWEVQAVSGMGSAAPASTRFIEANELESGCKLGGVLDITPTFNQLEGKEAELFEDIIDSLQTLPLLNQYPGIKTLMASSQCS
ncbi:hypothetical protein M422DRAFT_260294 [Sphaerobolus stellatus SS14]|uniref:Uncharacterized protein n=1 Tax=Sphaerobolus stellatus (strain SS14) TaxID=990650 RepID=A0A0C9VHY5_SPHS4|nr:hypothetical protein M422DRAFT_260294 [Sphaerobolus stellatus SS14]